MYLSIFHSGLFAALAALSIIPFLLLSLGITRTAATSAAELSIQQGQGDAVGWSQNVISATAGSPQTASVMHFHPGPRLQASQSGPDWLNWFAPV